MDDSLGPVGEGQRRADYPLGSVGAGLIPMDRSLCSVGHPLGSVGHRLSPMDHPLGLGKPSLTPKDRCRNCKDRPKTADFGWKTPDGSSRASGLRVSRRKWGSSPTVREGVNTEPGAVATGIMTQLTAPRALKGSDRETHSWSKSRSYALPTGRGSVPLTPVSRASVPVNGPLPKR
jgi:hypothetical protein